MKVLIGTNNLGKVEGAKQAFEKFYKEVEIVGISVNSDVSNETVNDEIINTDLGIVMDKIFKGNGLKNEKGGIAHLTKDAITRYDLTREAFIMALTEFINGDIWKD